MSLRDWLLHPPIGVGIAIGILLFSAAALEHQKRYAECRNSSPNQNCDRAFEYVGHAGIPPITGIQTPPRDKEPSRDQWRGEQDLQAQWDMSRWAFWAVMVSLMSVFVTSIGVVYVARTLDATRAAVDAANRTADSAERIGKAQVRAYLYCSGATYRVLDNMLLCKLAVKNAGQSPSAATEFSLLLTIRAPEKEDRIRKKAYHAKPESTLGPPIPSGGKGKTHVMWLHDELPEGVIEELISGMATFNIQGTMAWGDVFRERQESVFFLHPDSGAIVELDHGVKERIGKMRVNPLRIPVSHVTNLEKSGDESPQT